MLTSSQKSLAAVFGAWLLLPAIWGYYAQWNYLTAYNTFFYGMIFFILSVVLWFIFLLLHKGNVYRASTATFLYIVAFHFIYYILGRKYVHFIYYILGREYILSDIGYIFTNLFAAVISLFLSHRNRVVNFVTATSVYLSIIIFLSNYLFIPVYRYLRYGYSFIPMSLDSKNVVSNVRNIYLILLDEFPSPSVSKEIFVGADTLIIKLKEWGFVGIDSINSNIHSGINLIGFIGTAATISSIYRVTHESNSIQYRNMSNAKPVDILDSLQYQKIGIWPFYAPIANIKFSWEPWILPTNALWDMPITSYFSSYIKHIYDVSFYWLVKSYVLDYSDSHLRFHHIHFFISHYPYVTGKGGRWLSEREMSLYERIREAYAFEIETLLEFIQTIKLDANHKGAPDPIIFVMSDHGMHGREPQKLNISDQTLADNLKQQAFFMAYVPFWPDSVVRQQLTGCHDFRCISTFIETVAKANLLHESSHPNSEK